MDKATHSDLTKGMVISLGLVCVAYAFAALPSETLSAGFVLVLVFSMVVGPRMSLTLPRSRFAISFSDAAVFLTFLLYGGPAAILVAALESLANCLHLKAKDFYFGRWMVPTNVAINTISFTFTYIIWLNIPKTSFNTAQAGSTQHLFTSLGSLAIIHFVASSLLFSIFAWLKDRLNPWTTIVQNCFASSMTQIVGAGLAGLVYKIINFGDLVTGVIAFFAVSVAYLSYRRSIAEVKEAMQQAESAEREKAQAERELRIEAEKYVYEIAVALEKEESANEALRKSEKDLQHAALYDSLTGLPNR